MGLHIDFVFQFIYLFLVEKSVRALAWACVVSLTLSAAHCPRNPKGEATVQTVPFQLLWHARHICRRGNTKLCIVSLSFRSPPPSLRAADKCSRIADLKDGHCVIGMKSPAMIPLISFDAIANV